MPSGTPRFRPPFCPNPKCDSHASPHPWRYIKKGFYLRDLRPQRIQRYACTHCDRRFSSQTFSTTYWLKRPELQLRVFWRLLGCSGYRQIAREFDASHATIQRPYGFMRRYLRLVGDLAERRGVLLAPGGADHGSPFITTRDAAEMIAGMLR